VNLKKLNQSDDPVEAWILEEQTEAETLHKREQFPAVGAQSRAVLVSVESFLIPPLTGCRRNYNCQREVVLPDHDHQVWISAGV
jgi:hypothetical protein